MGKNFSEFIQKNSPDGGFLQSEVWRKFQESVGRDTFFIEEKNDDEELIASAGIITHKLPMAGDYFYIPRGPVFSGQGSADIDQYFGKFLENLLDLSKKNNIGWIRVEPESEKLLEIIRDLEIEGNKLKIVKASVDMQPREILVLDISKSEEEILAGMKQKTRYNIRLSQKKVVRVTCNEKRETENRIEEFLRLVKITAKRDGITPHPENYYRKMFEAIPSDILKLYIAEYEGKVIAANLVLFFGETATYMHGASDNTNRDAMATYLLQWRAIQDAKKAGCGKYDLGGVRTEPHPSPLLSKERGNSWRGITKFKTGFAPNVEPVRFPGSYDIILKPVRYRLYWILRKVKKYL
ncbi:MAG: peptidoglycan bridge formation glycyltransferase FemA/FemB family protein [Candidatus Moranbacteria bacterium]|nr:peptidoglycan bridge formation glycyltransferase FemA/FemB family protein [Candidatus Moranbacteria bacterium]